MKVLVQVMVFAGVTLGAWWVFRAYTTWSNAWAWFSAVPVGFVSAQGAGFLFGLASGGKEA